MSSLVNALIGEYLVTDFVGEGGMGEVYKATHTHIGRVIAIKVLSQGVTDPNTVRRFYDEAGIQASLRHPGVAEYLGFYEYRGRPCILMEFVDGETIASILNRRGAIPPSEAFRIACATSEVVAHFHKNGVLHRDIKSGNVKINSAGAIKVLDFGIARFQNTQKLTSAGMVIGTPGILAPEQVRGREVTPATDVWQLGILMYEMLTGKLPFGADNPSALYAQILNADYPPVSRVQTTIAPSFGPDRVHEWSLGIQRQVTTNSAFEVRYVGNHGWDLFQSINANPYFAGLAASYPQFVPSGLTPCATPLPTVPSALGRVSCSAGVTDETANSGFSNYNSVQTELRTTALAHQLTLKMGYTFSKTMDNVSEIFSTGLGGNTIAYSQNVLNYKGQEYGLSGLDTPNVWTVAFTEDIPFMRSQQGIVGHILGGWVISGNYIIASGEPYTPSQIELNVLSGGVANDTAFDLANPGTLETSRPFVGSLSAPTQNVGIYAADACAVYNVGCSIAASTLISLNAVNANGSVVNISKNQVHFIANGGEADAIFGNPFGNAGRNSAREYWTNTGNFSLYKNIKFWERVNLQWHMTMVNVFNHPNYTGINPFIENAGNPNFFSGFANPYLQTGSIRTIYFGLKIIF